MMVLGFTGGALGGHLAGWRHRDSFPTTAMQLSCMVEMAQIAERGKLDLMFLADGNGVRQMDKPALFAANSPSDRPAVFEPVTLFAARGAAHQPDRPGGDGDDQLRGAVHHRAQVRLARSSERRPVGLEPGDDPVCRGRQELRPRRAYGPDRTLRARAGEPRRRAHAVGFLGDRRVPRRTRRPADISIRRVCGSPIIAARTSRSRDRSTSRARRRASRSSSWPASRRPARSWRPMAARDCSAPPAARPRRSGNMPTSRAGWRSTADRPKR